VMCNEQYRARLEVEEPECAPGASYRASVQRLVRGGYMQLVSEDDDSRVLELHREDGTCLLIDERPLAAGGFVTLVTDVTERRRTDNLLASIREEQRQLARRYHEEKLRAEAASRSKTSFLAHLSHDIRTPLNHIIGFADLMCQETYGPLGDARYLDYVEAMKLSGERLLSFFASILELAELESGRKPLRQEPFLVDELLGGVARRFGSQAQRASLALSLGAPCGAEVVGDRFSLERMLCNVVENAVRFTPHGGKVTLSAYAASDGVVIEITDTGIGMSEEQLATLSQPFVFGDAALTRDHGGAGLGIAIARTIAELSGGRLAIDSRLALGTTVAVSLPLGGVERAEAA
jgi:two-component system cell cycle sensor histidine kinase PleC